MAPTLDVLVLLRSSFKWFFSAFKHVFRCNFLGYLLSIDIVYVFFLKKTAKFVSPCRDVKTQLRNPLGYAYFFIIHMVFSVFKRPFLHRCLE